MFTGTIDVSKINKEKLYKGKKGIYLNITFWVDEEKDQYGNNGMIVESSTKAERDAGNKGNILGNVKVPEMAAPVAQAEPEWNDDLPF